MRKSHLTKLAPIGVLLAFACTPGAAWAVEPPVGYANFHELSETHTGIVAHGAIQLHSSILGKIECLNTFYAEGWNAHEHGESTKPLRGYGEVLGWGTSACTAPEEIASLEKTFHRKITVVASAELPFEEVSRQGLVCTEESKTELSQCPNESERQKKFVITEFHRRVSSLPWKVELITGEREEEPGVLERVGLVEHGESGTASAHNTKCYPGTVEHPASYLAVPAGCVVVDIIFPQVPYEFIFYGSQEIWSVNGFSNGINPSRLEWKQSGTLYSSEGGEGLGETTGEVRVMGAEAVQLLTSKCGNTAC